MDSHSPSKPRLSLNGFSECVCIFFNFQILLLSFPNHTTSSSQLLFCPPTSEFLKTANATGPGATQRECRELGRVIWTSFPQHFLVIFDLRMGSLYSDSFCDSGDLMAALSVVEECHIKLRKI